MRFGLNILSTTFGSRKVTSSSRNTYLPNIFTGITLMPPRDQQTFALPRAPDEFVMGVPPAQRGAPPTPSTGPRPTLSCATPLRRCNNDITPPPCVQPQPQLPGGYFLRRPLPCPYFPGYTASIWSRSCGRGSSLKCCMWGARRTSEPRRGGAGQPMRRSAQRTESTRGCSSGSRRGHVRPSVGWRKTSIRACRRT